MKKTIHYTLIILSCITILYGAKRPAWVDSTPNNPHLYQGFGVADKSGSAEEDRLRADQNARAEIIREISSTISSEVSSYYQEATASGNINVEDGVEIFTSLSSAFANATIEGIKIVDRYYDRKQKVYYSYATLLRSTFQSQMARQADEAAAYAAERFGYAQKAIQTDDISVALNHLSSALSHVLVAQSIVKRHLDGDLAGDGKREFLDIRLSHELSTLIHDIRFTKLSEDNQAGERSQALPHSLNGQVSYEQNGKAIPLINLPLRVNLEGATAELNKQIMTNQDGYFEVRIDKLSSASSPTPQVIVNLDLPQLSLMAGKSDDWAALASGGVHFSIKMDVAASVSIFVRILEEIDGERVSRSKSEATMIKALVSQKYKVIDAMRISRSVALDDLDFSLYYEDYSDLSKNLAPYANYAIVGVVSSETSSTGTLNYARASAKINVIDLKSGRIVSSGNQANIKAAGNTEIKANTSALRKCAYAAITDIMRNLETALN